MDVYFADLSHTGVGINANTFPLGIGQVAAWAKRQFPELRPEIFKLPTDLNRALTERMPRMLCLSNFVWNCHLACSVAARVREVAPETVIVMGGPNLPLDVEGRLAFLKENPAVDFHIRGDGERAFAALLGCLLDADMNPQKVKEGGREGMLNCSFMLDGELIEGREERVLDLASIPSPYMTGLFDKFFDNAFTPLIQTTRGCPFSCTFCNDGKSSRSKISHCNQDAIQADLEYAAQRTKIPMLVMADLNFGMYQEDIKTAETLRDTIRQYGWPKRIDVSVGKCHPDRIMQVMDIINSASPGTFKFGASFQSTAPEVLGNIKRKNVPFESLVALQYKRGESDEHFTEFILGLPGDSKERHFQSLSHAIDLLGLNNIDSHQLVVLPGTELALPAERLKFGLEHRYRAFVGCIGVYEFLGKTIPSAEVEEVVVANAEMSREDYLDCREMDLSVKIFVDYEPFREVFSFVRWLKLSEFGLLRYLKERVIQRYPDLVDMYAEFRRINSAFLFNDRESARSFLSVVDNVKKYLNGELGLNEIVHYRAVAALHHAPSCHAALADAAVEYLREAGQLTPSREAYLREAVEFSRLRKCDFNDVEGVRSGIFSFDFKALREVRFAAEPSDFAIPPTRLEFYHDADAIVHLKEMIAAWTSYSKFHIGKVFQKANVLLFNRHVRAAGEVGPG